MRLSFIAVLTGFLLLNAGVGHAGVMLSKQWGETACEAWNKDEVLTKGLFESGWINNPQEGRTFRIIEIFREDCKESPHIQLVFEPKDEMAVCIESRVATEDKYDFLMWAETSHWVEMGKGEYGPMWAMMFNNLGFKGSMIEAMQNMGPFENFLLLFGKIPTTGDECN